MVLVENYEDHCKKWLQCFNDPKKSDVVFEANDGQTFHCEKFVLEVASPYFERLFSCGKDSKKFVSARDVDPAALKWILRSCYTGDGDLNDDNVVSVMVAAKMYEMSWVWKACMKYLKEDKGRPVAAYEYSPDLEKWQEWKVPQSGWYHIVAMGAKAADQPKVNAQLYKSKGGEGAIVGGSFELKQNDVVQILTGGMSRVQYPNNYTGGGGGTFVALKTKELALLLAAGGGGSPNSGWYGSDANLGEDGIGSNPKCVGGKNGGNGQSNRVHQGGLGWKAGPTALAKPGTEDIDNTGGFGGGGDLCGGGGGYSGGSAGYHEKNNASPGGGGSYIASTAVNSWKKVGSSGHGKVSIWGGKKVPVTDILFVEQVGKINNEPQTQTCGNGETIDSWELLE